MIKVWIWWTLDFFSATLNLFIDFTLSVPQLSPQWGSKTAHFILLSSILSSTWFEPILLPAILSYFYQCHHHLKYYSHCSPTYISPFNSHHWSRSDGGQKAVRLSSFYTDAGPASNLGIDSRMR